MSAFSIDMWTPILSRLNSIILESDRWKEELTPECLSIGWCGSLPATESEILRVEDRLGVRLPPSYRSFLSVSNGWRPFSGAVERLLTVQEIEHFRAADPKGLAEIEKYYKESDLSDEQYLDYETPKNMEALRHRYYAGSLLVGTGWGVEADMILLNPQIVFPDGEWEAICFANWIPGNQRYRSFFELVKYSVTAEEGFEQSRSSYDGSG
jgi:hypothetical protein